MSDELTQALQSLFVVALVSALAPLIVGILPRLRVPQVVVLILGGVIVGPQVSIWPNRPASNCYPTSVWAFSFCWLATNWS